MPGEDNGSIAKTFIVTIVSSVVVMLMATFLYMGWRTAAEAQTIAGSVKNEVLITDGKVNVLAEKFNSFLDRYEEYIHNEKEKYAEQKGTNKKLCTKLENITRSLLRLEMQQEANINGTDRYRRGGR